MVAERLRAAVEQQTVTGRSEGDLDRIPTYSISLGVATLQEGESFPALMRRADSALYDAKAAGRNTVISASKAMRVPEENATSVQAPLTAVPRSVAD
jgi:diguanylate cyclase (GGDEF)-like protein